mgnify:CR=1 FL=1
MAGAVLRIQPVRSQGLPLKHPKKSADMALKTGRKSGGKRGTEVAILMHVQPTDRRVGSSRTAGHAARTQSINLTNEQETNQ